MASKLEWEVRQRGTTTDPRSILLVAQKTAGESCEEYGSGIRNNVVWKYYNLPQSDDKLWGCPNNNEKNQRSAAGLYIAPGFAHIGS